MIKYIKGCFLGKIDSSDEDARAYVTSVFKFREKAINISNLKECNDLPYLGCEIDRASALLLRDWLTECLQDERCDFCWDYKVPWPFKGELSCTHCGNKYQ